MQIYPNKFKIGSLYKVIPKKGQKDTLYYLVHTYMDPNNPTDSLKLYPNSVILCVDDEAIHNDPKNYNLSYTTRYALRHGHIFLYDNKKFFLPIFDTITNPRFLLEEIIEEIKDNV
jgi:hypothetical protein